MEMAIECDILWPQLVAENSAKMEIQKDRDNLYEKLNATTQKLNAVEVSQAELKSKDQTAQATINRILNDLHRWKNQIFPNMAFCAFWVGSKLSDQVKRFTSKQIKNLSDIISAQTAYKANGVATDILYKLCKDWGQREDLQAIPIEKTLCAI
jgi:anion-transporting  ArsA/GET3 family ATPase